MIRRRSVITGKRLARARLAQSGPTHVPSHGPMPDQETKDG